MEDRCTPSTVSWDGGGFDNMWDNPLNWDTDALPGAADDVQIFNPAGPITNYLPATTVNSINASAFLHFTGSLALSASSSFEGYVEVQGYADFGGPLAIQGGTYVDLYNGAAFQADVTLAAAGATLMLYYGTFDIAAGLTFSGLGTTINYYATMNLAGDLTIEDFQMIMGGTVQGTGDIFITRAMSWAAGTLEQAGDLHIAESAYLDAYSWDHPLLGGSLINEGTVRLSNGNLRLAQGDIFNKPGALFDIQDDSSVVSTGAPATFWNEGSLVKSGTGWFGQGTEFDNFALNSSGAVDVQTGTLALKAGGELAGTAQAAEGAKLDLIDGTFAMLPGFWFSGGGFIILGSDANKNPLALVFGTNTVSNWELTNNGILAGPGILLTTQEFIWNSGNMRGTGRTEIASGAIMTLTGNGQRLLEGRKLWNYETINWTAGSNPWIFTRQAEIINYGQFNINAANDARLERDLFGPHANFENYGIIRKSGSQTAKFFYMSFFQHATGLIVIEEGRLHFDEIINGIFCGPINNISGEVIFTVVANGTYTFTPNLEDGPNHLLQGLGWYIFDSDARIISPEFDLVEANNVRLANAILEGLGTFAPNHLRWIGGEMQGAGITKIREFSRLEIIGGGEVKLSGRQILNEGIMDIGGQGDNVIITVSNNGTIINDGGTFPGRTHQILPQLLRRG